MNSKLASILQPISDSLSNLSVIKDKCVLPCKQSVKMEDTFLLAIFSEDDLFVRINNLEKFVITNREFFPNLQ